MSGKMRPKSQKLVTHPRIRARRERALERRRANLAAYTAKNPITGTYTHGDADQARREIATLEAKLGKA